MPNLIKGDDVKSETEANASSQPVAAGTGVNGLISFCIDLNAADSIVCKPVLQVRRLEVSFLNLNTWEFNLKFTEGWWRSKVKDNGELVVSLLIVCEVGYPYDVITGSGINNYLINSILD